MSFVASSLLKADAALKPANTRHLEAMAIQTIKDSKKSKADNFLDLQMVLDLMLEKQVLVADFHPSIMEKLNQTMRS